MEDVLIMILTMPFALGGVYSGYLFMNNMRYSNLLKNFEKKEANTSFMITLAVCLIYYFIYIGFEFNNEGIYPWGAGFIFNIFLYIIMLNRTSKLKNKIKKYTTEGQTGLAWGLYIVYSIIIAVGAFITGGLFLCTIAIIATFILVLATVKMKPAENTLIDQTVSNQETINCTSCGENLLANVKFCSGCGMNLITQTQTGSNSVYESAQHNIEQASNIELPAMVEQPTPKPMKPCPQCNNNNVEEAKFCIFCNNNLI